MRDVKGGEVKMITKINKLKNFGIYRDFSWNNDIPQFQRYNLIYGWNKSGKTTLSRVLLACEKQTVDFETFPKNGEFQIEFEDAPKLNQDSVQECNSQIRVFNTDFVEENVSFDPTNSSNPIVYLSEEDIKKIEKLEELRTQRVKKNQNYEKTKQDRKNYEQREDDFRIQTAKLIKNTLTTSSEDKFRNYNKTNLSRELSRGLDAFQEMPEAKKESELDYIRKNSSPLQSQNQYKIKQSELSIDGAKVAGLNAISSEIQSGLESQVTSKTIAELKKDPELNSWVQKGFAIHQKHNETEKCLFCGNQLDEGLLNKLSDHFSTEYQQTQEWARRAKIEVEKAKIEPFKETNDSLYPDLQDQFSSTAKTINSLIEKVNNWIDQSIQKLDTKMHDPLKVLQAHQPPKGIEDQLQVALEDLNKVIDTHNEKVKSHDKELLERKQKIEQHLIAEAIRTEKYDILCKELEASREAEKEAQEENKTINQEISKLEKETSDIAIAVEEINNYLCEFFGRQEILIQLDENKKGYIIHREGEIAQSLSEGEKNAIAFAYFIVKTREKNFDIRKAIIFIDDPISSFDSNFIYHCFSLIKNCFRESKQLIISTHNFEFFNLVKNWYRQVTSSAAKKAKKRDEDPTLICEYFMIENPIIEGKRCACVEPLEETLKTYKSEYQYLFSRLKSFLDGDNQEYAWFYIIGNLARRFLETYLSFKIPNSGDLRSKIDQLQTPSVSDVEKEKLYQLIQEESHGRDPMSALEHKDKREIINAIEVLFKIIQESDPKHFETLQRSL